MILSGITKTLGEFTLSIERLIISKPGIYGLVGPNGSGKTTLAKLITGLIAPDSGIIDTQGLGSRDITLLTRKPYMMDDSVYNNLVYPLRLRNMLLQPDLIEHYLEIMGLAERRKQKAKSLSSGEQQKLALLRAFIFRPRLIVADEAMTALDIHSLGFFENMIYEEQIKDPVIWIIISHQMSHVRRLASRLFFMYNGNIEAEGSMGEISAAVSNPHLEQYLNVYGDGIQK